MASRPCRCLRPTPARSGARSPCQGVKGFDGDPIPFLSTVRGLIDWYELTGEGWLLDKARHECDRIFADGMLDTWGVPESFANPQTDEGCSEVDWVLVNLRLFQATGERRYLETAERAVYGHFYLNQSPNGGFGAWHGFHGAIGARKPGSVGRYIEAFWCCSMHGAFCGNPACSAAARWRGAGQPDPGPSQFEISKASCLEQRRRGTVPDGPASP